MIKYFCDICGEPATHGGILYEPVGTLKVRTGVEFLIPETQSDTRHADLCHKHRIEMLELIVGYLKNPDPFKAGLMHTGMIAGPAGMCD